MTGNILPLQGAELLTSVSSWHNLLAISTDLARNAISCNKLAILFYGTYVNVDYISTVKQHGHFVAGNSVPRSDLCLLITHFLAIKTGQNKGAGEDWATLIPWRQFMRRPPQSGWKNDEHCHCLAKICLAIFCAILCGRACCHFHVLVLRKKGRSIYQNWSSCEEYIYIHTYIYTWVKNFVFFTCSVFYKADKSAHLQIRVNLLS
jgi:hypothetical protein